MANYGNDQRYQIPVGDAQVPGQLVRFVQIRRRGGGGLVANETVRVRVICTSSVVVHFAWFVPEDYVPDASGTSLHYIFYDYRLPIVDSQQRHGRDDLFRKRRTVIKIPVPP